MSQRTQILAHLKRGKTLTALQALSMFHCLRLAARVSDLRDSGYPVETTIIRTRDNKRVARYWMAS